MDQKGWVANHDGNISVRLDRGKFAVTPGGRSKFTLIEADLLEISSDGKAFSEFPIHQWVYSLRPDINAVVHAHPPSATAVGSANQEMTTWPIPEAVVSLGSGVPLVGLALPGSEKLQTEMKALIPYYDAVLVGGNGVFAWGASLEQAFLRLEIVEHLASVFLAALPLGGPMSLPASDVKILLEKRKGLGLARPQDPARPQWFPE